MQCIIKTHRQKTWDDGVLAPSVYLMFLIIGCQHCLNLIFFTIFIFVLTISQNVQLICSET